VRRPEDDWEELARREPHFAVLTSEEFLAERLTPEALQRFFASGESDVAFLFGLASEYTGRPFAPHDVVDFGCGTGRLSLALARRAAQVFGVDAAPTMLDIARRHRDEAALGNVEFPGSLDAIRPSSIDFVCSLIVFQHIPTGQGEMLLQRLLGLLRRGGVAAIHVTFTRPGGWGKRVARKLRGRFPIVHRLAQTFEGDRRRLPYMQINTYSRERLAAIAAEANCREPRFVPFDQGEIQGAILLTEKMS
jgi:SAM-dependent methyltransferase